MTIYLVGAHLDAQKYCNVFSGTCNMPWYVKCVFFWFAAVVVVVVAFFSLRVRAFISLYQTENLFVSISTTPKEYLFLVCACASLLHSQTIYIVCWLAPSSIRMILSARNTFQQHNTNTHIKHTPENIKYWWKIAHHLKAWPVVSCQNSIPKVFEQITQR